mmetsp:Transcript_108746/g.347078  ORF Transcript_108746/g.347078 Transcript_108746/m.347078 type:complete len:282 (-) Transcript_108746:6-851(-)
MPALRCSDADVEDLELGLLQAVDEEAKGLGLSVVRLPKATHESQLVLSSGDDVPHWHAQQLVCTESSEDLNDSIEDLAGPDVVHHDLLPVCIGLLGVALSTFGILRQSILAEQQQLVGTDLARRPARAGGQSLKELPNRRGAVRARSRSLHGGGARSATPSGLRRSSSDGTAPAQCSLCPACIPGIFVFVTVVTNSAAVGGHSGFGDELRTKPRRDPHQPLFRFDEDGPQEKACEDYLHKTPVEVVLLHTARTSSGCVSLALPSPNRSLPHPPDGPNGRNP